MYLCTKLFSIYVRNKCQINDIVDRANPDIIGYEFASLDTN